MRKPILIALMATALFATLEAKDYRTVKSVENVSVEVPVGNAPRLPYQLWVEYNDGKGEYRQVKWLNSSEATETAEANPQLNPTGTVYKVRGFIIGDNSTPNGYPVSAQVTVVDGAFPVPSSTPVAETLPLDCVQLQGNNRLTWNCNLDIDQLISLPVKQQLYNYRDTYGLPTEGYPESDGWDSPTTKLKGHGSGHYMSAMAFAFASCQDQVKKAVLRENIKTMINELRHCQELTFVWDDKLGRYWEARDFAPEEELKQMKGTWADFDRYKGKEGCRKYGYGYLNAIPAQHCVLIEMYRAYNNEDWVWAPYYSVHKQLAGLIDIATYIDDKDVAAKALLTAKDMGLWVWNRLHYRTFVKSDGTQEERRAKPGNRHEMWNMYIAGEVGGMAESLARLAEMTGTPEEKAHLAEAANYFDSPAFFNPLARNIDAIRTRHANQHIPMVTGALRSFRSNNDPFYYNVAQNFWTMIQGRYRYAMGGVGNGEMFRQPYSQITSMCMNVTSWGGRELHPEPTINETCCAYNLAKLTKDLNCFNPDDARYMDYYERVLYNQIVGSVNPKQYATVYQYAVGLDASKPWGNETPQSTCCGGTGAENHVKYQEAAYFVNDNTLWVALYLPTTAQWEKKGITLKQECEWPAQRSTIRIANGSAKFAMKLRVPYWATEGFDVRLNGKSIAKHYQPSSYVEIPARQWSKKDVVEVIMPFTKHLDFGPDKMEKSPAYQKDGKTEYTPMWTGTFMYGPLVMATTGIKNWDEATISVASDLSNITTHGDKGSDHLYTISCGGHDFLPDYAGDEHLTHYFRMDIETDPNAKSQILADSVDRSQLRELMLIARSRINEQQAWNALAVKVPEYAPWAKNAYQRMEALYESSRIYMDAPKNKYTQEEIDKVAGNMNVAINTMRPGNLPELEDMDELMQLLEEAKKLPVDNEKANRAIGYAGMVIRYVSDGSGTMDMIERATRQLKEVLGK